MVQFQKCQLFAITIFLSLFVHIQAQAFVGRQQNTLNAHKSVRHSQDSESANNLNPKLADQKQKSKIIKTKKSAYLRRNNDQLKRMSTRTVFYNRPRFKEWKR